MSILFDQARNGTRIVILPLLYHVALYTDYRENGIGIEFGDRYCIKNLLTAIKAAEGFFETGTMRHWQKWHNKNITISQGYAYADGEIHQPEYALYAVDWTEGIHECNN
jgi:hypothetical protein